MLTLKLSALRRQIPLLFLLALAGLTPATPVLAALLTPAVTVTSSANPSIQGTSVSFNAIVTGTGASPTGNVVIVVDGMTALPLDPLTPGTGPTPGNGIPIGTSVTSLPYTTLTLSPGTHTITAVYGGDGGLVYSPNSGSLTQTVKANTTTTINAPPTPPSSTFGQAVTFQATVAPTAAGAGTPTGTVTFSDTVNGTLGSVALNGTGTATLTISTLSVNNSHSITAQYSGDAFNAGSTSGAFALAVSAAGTTITTPVAVPASPSTFGQSITLNTMVSVTAPGAGIPTGTVTFTDGAGFTLTTSVASDGKASVTTSGLSIAIHNITVQYGGDANFSASSVSGPLVFTTNAEPTATSVTSSINPSALGQAVVFTVSVTGQNGVPPTGTVTLTYPGSGGGPVTTSPGVALDGNGQAQITVSDLAVGAADTVTANYTPSPANFLPSSGSLSQKVTATSNPVSLTASVNPSAFNQAVTFTATVAASAGVFPTGTIQFKDGTSNLGTPITLNGLGSATLTVPAAPADPGGPVPAFSVGTHPITAVYTHAPTDTNYANATSGTLTQVVNRGATTTALSVTPVSATTVFGQPVTLTATVSGGTAGTPGGTVQFLDGGLLIATVAVAPGAPNTAAASYTTSALAVAAHNITAVYSGDTNFSGSGTAATAVTVNTAATTTSVISGPSTASFNQPVTIVATVTPTAPGGGTPSGSVTFTYQNGSDPTIMPLRTVNLDTAGQATLTTTALPVGPNTITATYTPTGGSYIGSAGNVVQTVGTSATVVSVTSTPNPSVFGQAVQFTATAASGGPTPQGTIQFKDNGAPIALPPGVSNSVDASGQLTISVSSLSVGTHVITADFAPATGDPSSPGSGTLPGGQLVNQAATGVTVSSSNNPQTVNQPVTFTAAISVVSPGAGTPTGTVQFKDGATNLGSPATVSTTSGVTTATVTTSALTAGAHNITAVYNGDGADGNFVQSTSPGLAQNIGKAVPTAAIVSAPNPSTFSQPVTFTATITGVGNITPTTTVTFQDTFGGTTTSLGVGTLSGTGNQATATLTTPTLAAGAHSVAAVYGGDNSYLPAASTPVNQAVGATASATQVASNANPSTFSQNVTFTATVTSAAGTPTGSVTFQDDGSTVATTALDSTGKATFSTGALTAKLHTITALYNPDVANFSPSSGQVIQDVKQAASNVNASLGPNPSIYGQPVTFTTVVSGTGGVSPTGTIAFTSAGQNFGTATLAPSGLNAQNKPTSTATFAYSALPAGDNQVVITYSGDPANTGGSVVVTGTVFKADSAAEVTSSANPSTLGQPVTFTATVVDSTAGSTGKPTGTVTFLDGGKPIPSADPANPNPAPLALNKDGSVTTAFTTAGLSVATDTPHIITVIYNPDANFNGSTSLLRGGQTVFDLPASITNLTPSYLLVPGTSRDGNHAPLGPSDSQLLTITGASFRSDAFVLFNGDKLIPTAVAPDGSALQVLVPPGDVSVAGFSQVQVVNLRQAQTGAAPNATRAIPVNPVKALPNFAVPNRPDKFLRMFSIPFDYSAFSPYDVLAGVTLNPPLNGAVYNPDINLLGANPTVLSGATTPLYHWDPASLLYQTTLPNADPTQGLKPSDLHLTLGQGFWIVGGPETQTLGIMRLGTPSAFNPIGVPLLGGWNMIGDPFPRDIPLSSLRVLTQNGTTLTFADAVGFGLVSPVLWRWDGTQYVPCFDGAAGADSTLQQYEGYWLYSYQPITLLVTFPQ